MRVGASFLCCLALAAVAAGAACSSAESRVGSSDDGAFDLVAATGTLGTDPTVWPNEMSQANSDPWLVAHHDQLREIHPRILVLNYNNGTKPDDVRAFVEDKVFNALREGSRY